MSVKKTPEEKNKKKKKNRRKQLMKFMTVFLLAVMVLSTVFSAFVFIL